MGNLSAFVGHSFIENDKEVVEKFLGFLDRISKLNPWFTWDHAEPAEPKILSKKVIEKMENKNLFIGICTAKEVAIKPEKVKKCILNKNGYKIKKDNIDWKTSDWILQEIGFAVGRGMIIMILLEDIIRLPGGLQGDIEYIKFNRSEPEKADNKILEMLTSLRPKVIAAGSGIEKPIENESVKEGDFKEESYESEPLDDSEYRTALFDAILSKDKEKEKQVFDKYLRTQSGQDEYNRIQWEVDRLYLLQIINKENKMEELTKFYIQHRTHSHISFRLAQLYQDYRDFKKAASLFKDAAINSKNTLGKFSNLCNAAKSWAKDRNMGEMISSLNEAKDLIALIDDGESLILEVMGDIYGILNDNQNYLAFIEGYLDKKPYNHDTRFSLAYKYSQIDEHDLSLYHYKILTEQRQEKLDWNNIGWARESLKLPGKAIVSYRESEKLGETLAMSNLAYSLIDAGFFDDAKHICLKAKEIHNYNERVDFALSKISELKTSEDEKENDLLLNTKKLRLFYIEYAHACCKKLVKKFSGKYKGPDYELDIVIEDNKFEAIGSFEKTSFGNVLGLALGLGALALGSQEAKEKKTIMMVKYNGELIGQGIKYNLRISEKGSTQSLLSDNTESGLMIITDDLSEIKIYQKGTRASEKFYSLFRIE